MSSFTLQQVIFGFDSIYKFNTNRLNSIKNSLKSNQPISGQDEYFFDNFHSQLIFETRLIEKLKFWCHQSSSNPNSKNINSLKSLSSSPSMNPSILNGLIDESRIEKDFTIDERNCLRKFLANTNGIGSSSSSSPSSSMRNGIHNLKEENKRTHQHLESDIVVGGNKKRKSGELPSLIAPDDSNHQPYQTLNTNQHTFTNPINLSGSTSISNLPDIRTALSFELPNPTIAISSNKCSTGLPGGLIPPTSSSSTATAPSTKTANTASTTNSKSNIPVKDPNNSELKHLPDSDLNSISTTSTPSVTPNSTSNSKKREVASLEQKIEILAWFQSHGENQTQTAKHFDKKYPELKLSQPLISSWLKNASHLHQQYYLANQPQQQAQQQQQQAQPSQRQQQIQQSTSASSSRPQQQGTPANPINTRRRQQKTKHVQVTEALEKWCQEAVLSNMDLNGDVIREKWREFATHFQVPKSNWLKLREKRFKRFQEAVSSLQDSPSATAFAPTAAAAIPTTTAAATATATASATASCISIIFSLRDSPSPSPSISSTASSAHHLTPSPSRGGPNLMGQPTTGPPGSSGGTSGGQAGPSTGATSNGGTNNNTSNTIVNNNNSSNNNNRGIHIHTIHNSLIILNSNSHQPIIIFNNRPTRINTPIRIIIILSNNNNSNSNNSNNKF
ncbi:hypothetical protein BY996DRAFT_6499179 [Phakopsora pachyrhizi]|nr:hypothetical protein BY996DRAFT_6499179 [Phakopsora pachyrhizi]